MKSVPRHLIIKAGVVAAMGALLLSSDPANIVAATLCDGYQCASSCNDYNGFCDICSRPHSCNLSEQPYPNACPPGEFMIMCDFDM